MEQLTLASIAVCSVGLLFWVKLRLFGKIKPNRSHDGAAAVSLAMILFFVSGSTSEADPVVLQGIAGLLLVFALYCVLISRRDLKRSLGA